MPNKKLMAALKKSNDAYKTNRITFMACPEHDNYAGYRRLVFISPERIKCQLCGKEYNFEQIRQYRDSLYRGDLQKLAQAYQQDMAMLQSLKEQFTGTNESEGMA